MIFVSGLDAPETPRLREDGSWMCVEGGPDRGSVTHITADGRTVRRVARTGCPNGLCIDRRGASWVAETNPHPSLMRVTVEGSAEIVMDRCGGQMFLLPNDLCFSKGGLLYMTDSGIRMADWAPEGRLREDWETVQFDGRVYEIDLRCNQVRMLDRGLRFPNGIAFGPDGCLYVNEMITGEIFRYRLHDSLRAGKRERFANVLKADWNGGFRGPDGMAFSNDGRLWCTVFGESAVAVLSPHGSLIARLQTEGSLPTNIAFGWRGERRVYVTEQSRGQIECFDVDAEGFPIEYGEL
jgi:gluconolactonase